MVTFIISREQAEQYPGFVAELGALAEVMVVDDVDEAARRDDRALRTLADLDPELLAEFLD